MRNRGRKTHMSTQKVTRTIFEAAILGFESQRERLAEQIAELRVMLDGRPAVLVVHAANAGSKLVEAWSCDGSQVLAFTTVPA